MKEATNASIEISISIKFFVILEILFVSCPKCKKNLVTKIVTHETFVFHKEKENSLQN